MTKSKKKAFRLKHLIVALIAISLIWLARYSIQEYERLGEARGITVCAEDECIKTFHIHSDITFDFCGQAFTLPRETGDLQGLHTHKEKNYLHFHDKVNLDPETRQQQPDKRLSVKEVMDMWQIQPENYCAGDSDYEISVTVNGEAPEEGLDYNWKDGDDIHLIFRK